MIFVTGNKGKYEEAKEYLGDSLQMKNLKLPEIQSNALSEIAVQSCRWAFEEVRQPCFVEDSGLFIHEFKGFPGPYSKYVRQTLGNKGILEMMKKKKNRVAEFRSVIAYAESNGSIHTFSGRVYGEITERASGKGWGFDPIFKPDGYSKTFGSDPKTKQAISHRALALKSFSRHLGLK